MTSTLLLFGDQLGPAYLEGHDGPVLMIESAAVFRRRRYHRAKAQLVLSAMRHRAQELGERCTYVRAETYAQGLAGVSGPVSVVAPTSRAALDLVHRLGLEVLPDRGFATSREDFSGWAAGRNRLLQEDFYRWQRRRFGILMEGEEPVGGRWNYDAENREKPPRTPTLGVVEPWWPTEDDIDQQVRADIDAWAADGIVFVGDDGPRWSAATRTEALAALDHFVTHRLPAFGPHEDAMLGRDPWMAHSGLSPALNLGLLDPLEVATAAEQAFQQGQAPLAGVEGFVRQVLGWREYVNGLYWHLPTEYRDRNALGATGDLPDWWTDLDAAGTVTAACLKGVLGDLRERGWVHHIPRLMVLGNYALQRGWDPGQVTAWFHEAFIDGYDWVMVPNVVGMSQHADGGLMATKPYASGGAYVNRMSDYCKGCPFDPKVRVGEKACPFTAGYWAFLDRNAPAFAGNHRMGQPLAGLARLADRDELVAQERDRADSAP